MKYQIENTLCHGREIVTTQSSCSELEDSLKITCEDDRLLYCQKKMGNFFITGMESIRESEVRTWKILLINGFSFLKTEVKELPAKVKIRVQAREFRGAG